MKKLTIILLIFSSLNLNAQSLDYGNDSQSIKICNALSGNNFSSGEEAANALDKILNVIGASKRFVLQPCDNINNALALTFKGVRYIMYDPEFMQNLSYSNDWNGMFVLAHEVGHHINGHSVDAVLSINDVVAKVSLSKKRIQELEADEFAGFVLGRLGAKLSDAISAVSKTPAGDDSYSTHPTRSKRIAAATRGFKESGGKVNSNQSVKSGQTIDSKYSNSRYLGVEYTTLNNYYSDAIYEGYVGVNSRKPFGYGTIYSHNGDVYKGEMDDGKRNGYGKKTYASSGNSYEGFWVSNAATGKGVFTYASGTRQIGNFVESKLNGKGKIIAANGRVFEGVWNKDVPIEVTVTELNGEEKKYGFLDNSKGEGFATYTNFYGIKTRSSFEGGRIKKVRGIYAFDNGRIYKVYNNKYFKKRDKLLNKKIKNTDLVYGVRGYIPKYIREEIDFNDKAGLGYGTQNFPDGAIYEGYFIAGKTEVLAGYGEMIYGPDDERESYMGIWWADNKNGNGILTYKNGKVEKGIFRNNEFFKKADFDLNLMQEILKDY